MRRYAYSNLVRIIVSSMLVAIFIPSIVYAICSFLIDQSVHILSLMLALSCVVSYAGCGAVIEILNGIAENSILFDKDKIQYHGRTVYRDSFSMRYFKLYISVLEPSLVIPKLHINGDDFSITCYLSSRDIKKLERLGYEIKKV